jgi:transcription initiation factor TFIID TATA-box-binding protein
MRLRLVGGGGTQTKAEGEGEALVSTDGQRLTIEQLVDEAVALEVEKALVLNDREVAQPYDLRICNVVGTAWTGRPVDLRKVQIATQGRYDEGVFPSSVSRTREPRTTNSLFKSGRILVTGASDDMSALWSAKEFIYKVNRELHTDYDVLSFKVQNIVCSFSLGISFDVKTFSVDHKTAPASTAHYAPDLFRGCSWRRNDHLVFVLFSSGRGVLTGATTWTQAHAAFHKAKDLFATYAL